MKAEIIDGKLVLTIPVYANPPLSSTGKSRIVATTSGNKETTLMVDGKPVIIGMTAYCKV